jgi:hypothetical protein
MSNEPGQDFTEIEELAEIPLSELVELQDLAWPQIEVQDLELPQDYLQDLTDRGVITEGLPVIDIDSRLLEGPELEQSLFHEPSREIGEAPNERDLDFER